MFEPYSGDLMGLPTDENHLNFRWCRDDCKVLFSAAQQGRGISSHLASDKKGLRHLKTAINDWCEFVKETFTDADMVIGKVDKPSIKRLLLKTGFELIYTWGNKKYLLVRRL